MLLQSHQVTAEQWPRPEHDSAYSRAANKMGAGTPASGGPRGAERWHWLRVSWRRGAMRAAAAGRRAALGRLTSTSSSPLEPPLPHTHSRPSVAAGAFPDMFPYKAGRALPSVRFPTSLAMCIRFFTHGRLLPPPPPTHTHSTGPYTPGVVMLQRQTQEPGAVLCRAHAPAAPRLPPGVRGAEDLAEGFEPAAAFPVAPAPSLRAPRVARP